MAADRWIINPMEKPKTAYGPAPAGRTKNEVSSIRQKKDALLRRLNTKNKASRMGVYSKLPKQRGKGTYKHEYVKGASEGFTETDFGVGQGAAIPYQIGTKNETVTRGMPTAKKIMPKKNVSAAASNKATEARKAALVRRAG